MRTANQERLSSVCRALNLDEWQRAIVERLINQDLKECCDEAVAHGMTISAEIVVENNQPVFDLPTRLDTRKALGQAILTARDNKIWRKE